MWKVVHKLFNVYLLRMSCVAKSPVLFSTSFFARKLQPNHERSLLTSEPRGLTSLHGQKLQITSQLQELESSAHSPAGSHLQHSSDQQMKMVMILVSTFSGLILLKRTINKRTHSPLVESETYNAQSETCENETDAVYLQSEEILHLKAPESDLQNTIWWQGCLNVALAGCLLVVIGVNQM